MAEQMIDNDLPVDAYEQEPEQQEDGSYVLDLDAAQEAEALLPQGFDDNLAERMPEPELDKLSTDLFKLLDLDKETHRKADELYADGLKRTGLSQEDAGTEAFSGSSQATHPMLMEACIDFAARAIKELFPSAGPVKISAQHIKTRADAKKADAKREYLNYQLTEQVEEYYAELQRGLSQTPLGGSQYLKLNWDRVNERPTAEYVPSDKMLLPYSAANFYSAERRTHMLEKTRTELEQQIEAGDYREINLGAPAQVSVETEPARVADKIEGREPDSSNEDGLRTLYEVHCLWRLEGDEAAPYIITLDEYTQKVLAIRRNWSPDDDRKQRLDWFVELPFIPWRGSKTIGLYHIIGGLSIAATGALRALLDSALINNLPMMFKLKGSKLNGQTVTVDGMRIIELEGPTGVSDIRDALMPQPFNPPSAVLYQLLEWLTNHARQTIGTAAERIADQRQDMPVGTVLALIEEGSHPTSAIHQGLHRAQAKAIKILCRLNATYGKANERLTELGLSAADFIDSDMLMPVSDPHIFSTAQRTAQLQAVMQLAQGAPQLYDAYWLHRRALEQLKTPDIDQILPPPKAPKELNPVAENLAMLMQRPVAAFPDQDHIAHLAVHTAFVLDPMTGGSQLMVPQLVGQMLEHFKQHIGMLYAQVYNELITEASGGIEISELMKDKALNPEIDKTLAIAAEQVHGILAQRLQPFQGVIQQMMQLAQQLAPKPQMDPGSQVALQLGQMEHQRRQQMDQATLQLDSQKQQFNAMMEQLKAQQEQQKQARDAELAEAELMLKADKQGKDQELAEAELMLKAKSEARADEAERLRQAIEAAQSQHERQLAELEQQFSQTLRTNEQQLDAHQQMLKAEIERHYKDTQNLVSYLKNEADNVTKERIAELRLTVESGMQSLGQRVDAAAQQAPAAPQQSEPATDPALIGEITDALRQLARSQVELRSYMDDKLARRTVSITKTPDGGYTGEVVTE